MELEIRRCVSTNNNKNGCCRTPGAGCISERQRAEDACLGYFSGVFVCVCRIVVSVCVWSAWRLRYECGGV